MFRRVGETDARLALYQRRDHMLARVYQRAFDNFAGQRNFALDQIRFKHEWILHLDADEIVTGWQHAL